MVFKDRFGEQQKRVRKVIQENNEERHRRRYQWRLQKDFTANHREKLKNSPHDMQNTVFPFPYLS